ncbi:uncharacterized protein LOC141598545 isoform X4 [Silene latifolia]
MEERRWPTLNPCKQKRIKATVVHHNDRLSLLPYDILLKIWSHLTTKEAASASLVSRTLKHMWLVHPLLNFEEKKPYTFRLPSYFMKPTALHFRNASSLSAMSIGSFLCSDFIGCTLDSLLIYCAQLECLELKSNLTAPCNLQIEQCPVFPNLKHLTLNVVADLDASILGWTPVIKACPVLQKLTLNLEARPPSECAPARRRYTVRKFDTHPLSSLKTLEIVGFLGHYVNLELVEFVIENADMLDELILDAMSPYVRKNSHKMFAYVPDVRSLDLESHKIALELLKKLPQSVKFVCR